ncbi:MAG: undecaprenyl-diphosphate phosphatase, partial [Pseudomonadota bacterium]
AIDVAVHVGTLFAVAIYFWRDVRQALIGLRWLAVGKVEQPGAFLALCLVVATIPVIIVGLLFKLTGLDEALRSIAVIGWTMIIFGIVLYWADTRSPSNRVAKEWTLRHAAIMGLWQVLALIPGTSRSGITITGGRFLGYERSDAARLAMLMSIPTILASGVLLGLDVVQEGNVALAWDAAIAALLAFLSALVALWGMMRFLKSINFTPYVIYRLILGLALLFVAYGQV